MVAYFSNINPGLRIWSLILPVGAAILLPAGQAGAEDWREKLNQGPRAVARPEHAMAPGGGPGGFAYSSSYRAGYNSNANADFDPVASPFVKSEQELAIVKPLGEARLGVHLRGSIEDAFDAGQTEYGTVEARTTLAAPLPGGRRVAVSAGYLMEDDRGLRSHDLGADIELRTPIGKMAHFLTATVNTVTYDPLQLPEGPFDLGDNDRLRLGLETGFDMPVHKGVSATLSAGLVELRYVRDTDLAGFQRSSSSAFMRAGMTFGGEGPLTGAFGAMLFRRDYSEARFGEDTVVLADADLAWRLNGKTRLGFQYLGDLEETPYYGASNELTGIAALTLTRQLGEDLTATLAIYEQRDDFLETVRDDHTRGAGVELTHRLAPGMSLAVAGEYETGATSLAGGIADVWKISAGFNFAYSK